MDKYRTKKWGIIKTIIATPLLGLVMWALNDCRIF
jgi:hypothetical protein